MAIKRTGLDMKLLLLLVTKIGLDFELLLSFVMEKSFPANYAAEDLEKQPGADAEEIELQSPLGLRRRRGGTL